MSDKDELAALKKKVEELEAKVSPPDPKPFVPAPFQRYDPTAGMTMPPSALRAMVNAVPDHVMRGIIRDSHAPTGPSSQGAIPSSQQVSNVRTGGGTGWAREIPLSNPPGVAHADRLMDEQDRRDRAELAQRLGALKR